MTRPPCPIPIITALVLVLTPPTSAHAAVAATDDITAYFRVMWGLLVVLAIILVLFALLKKRFGIINPRSTKAIRVLEIQPLMPKKSLCLIEVRGKEYLLGIANESITLLADISSSSRSSFQEILDDSQPGQQS